MAKLNAKTIITNLEKKYADKISGVREEKHNYGLKKKETLTYWFTVDKSIFKSVVSEICELSYPFLSVISGRDDGKNIHLIYHMYISIDPADSPGAKNKEEGLYLSVALPKNNPKIETITDLIPGARISEHEKQEMLGVNVEGIGDEKMFLPEQSGIKCPWTKESLAKQKAQADKDQAKEEATKGDIDA